MNSVDRAHAATYGRPAGSNTGNSHLYLWIMTAALKMSRTSLNKKGKMMLPTEWRTARLNRATYLWSQELSVLCCFDHMI